MCPACGGPLRENEFLCMRCAVAVADPLIVQIGAALDAGDQTRADAVIAEAVEAIAAEG